MTRSWKTTVLGICMIGSAIFNAGMAILDGDASTVVNWTTMIALITGGIGLIFAKDADKTGITKP